MICPKNGNDDKMNDEDLEIQRINTPIEKARKIWTSGCIRMDAEFVMYLFKTLTLIGLIIFFSYEMHISETCENTNIYQSLLCMVIGILMPQPKIR